MKTFEYASPKSLKDAIGLLSDHWGETEVLAGGTDLLTSIKQEVTAPGRVVSLKEVDGLSGIDAKGGNLTIGATTKLKDLIANADVQKHFPGLVTAAKNIGSAQIINAGTVAGDLLQRPRCWYFRNGFGLFGLENGKELIPDGDNRYHAIFGNSGRAKFVNPSSLAPLLIALGGSIDVQGPQRNRSVKAADFFSTPKSEAEREYALGANEIVTGISIPLSGKKNGVYEVRHRRGLDWPMVAAAVAFEERGGRVRNASVVLGHVAPTPWVADRAAAAMNGQSRQAGVQAAGNAAAQGATPLSKNAYKVTQVKVAVRRAIEAAS